MKSKTQSEFTTKDSGERSEFDNGFVRDTNKGKIRYDLIPPEMLKRLAELYTRGAEKYTENNWKLATGEKAINRFKESAWRHFMDWQTNSNAEEDHAMACCFNVFAYESLTK